MISLLVIHAEFQGCIRYQFYLCLDAPPDTGTCSQKDNTALPEKASELIRDSECGSGEFVGTPW